MTSGETLIGRGRAAVLALAALFCLAAFAPAAAFAGSISGTVTDAGTAEPIEGLEVCAYPLSEEGETWICEETDASGEYTIGELDPDEYTVEFWGRPLNYVPQYFDGKEAWEEADPVLVGAFDVTEVDAEMVLGGKVEGTVEEAGSGNPLEEVFVCAWTISSEEFGGCTESDFLGEYALKGMAAGAYEIEFWPLEQNFLPQWYDHRAHWWESDPVVVTSGAIKAGIDADLVAGATVEGQVRRASDGSPLTEVEVCAWSTDPEGAFRCVEPGGDGRYAIEGLPAGQYKVEFWPYDESLPVQFWDHKASWETANPLFLGTGSVTTGIDGDLGPGPAPSPPAVTPPAFTPSISHHRKRCKKGFRKKRVHGKVRCVKKKPKHRHRHVHGRPPVRDRATFRHGR